MKLTCFAVADGAREKDGLYKIFELSVVHRQRKAETPPSYPFSCKRKIATNRSVERKRDSERGILFLSFRTSR